MASPVLLVMAALLLTGAVTADNASTTASGVTQTQGTTTLQPSSSSSNSVASTKVTTPLPMTQSSPNVTGSSSTSQMPITNTTTASSELPSSTSSVTSKPVDTNVASMNMSSTKMLPQPPSVASTKMAQQSVVSTNMSSTTMPPQSVVSTNRTTSHLPSPVPSPTKTESVYLPSTNNQSLHHMSSPTTLSKLTHMTSPIHVPSTNPTSVLSSTNHGVTSTSSPLNSSVDSSSLATSEKSTNSMTLLTNTSSIEATPTPLVLRTSSPVMSTTLIAVDPCQGATCQHGGICIPGAHNYTCNCTAGWTGWNCAIDADDCASSPCQNGGTCSDMGLNTINCTCVEGYIGDTCQTVDYCFGNKCDNSATCVNGADNYTCTCSDKGWEGWNCDVEVDLCSSKPCLNEGNCTKTGHMNFTCACPHDWFGYICQININDQCVSSPCLFGFCQNLVDNYTCYCNDGTERLTCPEPDFCKNVTCGENEVCISNNASYSCQCQDGYFYRDDKCEEDVLFSYWASVSADTEVHGPYFADGGFPYFGQEYTAFYVNRNGYIMLEQYKTFKNPVDGKWPQDIKMVAPLWYHWDIPEGASLTISTIHRYKAEDDHTMNEITNVLNKTSFTPEFALVVTWRDVVPYPATEYNGFQKVTFQCTLVTDGSTSYAIFAYDDVELDPNVLQNLKIRYSTESNVNVTQFEGKRTRIIHELLSVSPNPSSMENYKCLNKIVKLPKPEREFVFNDTCPCTIEQAKNDTRFAFDDTTNCGVQRFGNTRAKCCYDVSYGSLLMNFHGAGYPLNDNEMITAEIDSANEICCGANASLCKMFYKKYPSDGCAKYDNLNMVQFWGNPVSKLPDGSLYIFNGLGEYYLAGSSESDSYVKGTFERVRNTDVTMLTTITIEVLLKIVIQDIKLRKILLGVQAELSKVVIRLRNGTGLEFDSEYDGVLVDGNNTDLLHRIGDTLLYRAGIYIEVIDAKELLFSLYAPKSEMAFFEEGIIALMAADSVNETEVEAAKLTQNSSEAIPAYFGSFNDFKRNLYETDRDAIELANTTCGNELYCIILLPDKSDRIKTLLMEKTAMASILRLRAPHFVNVSPVWNITVGEMLTEHIGAEPNVTYTLNTDNTAASFNSTTEIFSWTIPSNLTAKHFEFIIRNSQGVNTTFSPQIVFCPCQKASHCDYSVVDYKFSRSRASFLSAMCSCPDRLQCENENDPCLQCHPDATCNDTTPCTCPPHLEGDGYVCFDKNECANNVCGNNSMCHNYIGGFNCSCQPGFHNVSGRCEDIDECKSRTCPGYTDELRQYCENLPGRCRTSCRPTFRGSNCSVRVDYMYRGQIVFADIPGKKQHWTGALEDKNSIEFNTLATRVQNMIKAALEVKFSVKSVTVIEFIQLTSGSRRKRQTGSSGGDEISATYDAVMDNSASSDALQSAITSGISNCNPQNTSCSFGSGPNALLGVDKASTVIDDSFDLCASADNNNCHLASTECVAGNGTFNCQCRPGFQPWLLQNNVCQDIDECENKEDLCGDASTDCINLPGSYQCLCLSGYTWVDETTKCKFVNYCQSGPCKNGATCVNTEEAGYACKCAYGWTGMDCADKDEEAEKRRITIIAVSAALGSLCFILLVALCCVCSRRKKSPKKRNNDYMLAESDMDNRTRIPRPQEWRQSSQKHTKFDRQGEASGYTNRAYNGGATENDRL